MALLTASNFQGVVAPVPSQNGLLISSPPCATDAVTLTTSTGTYTVFDQVSTGLLCLAYMQQQQQRYLQLPNNIIVYEVGYAKLLLAEKTAGLVALFNATIPTYDGGVLNFKLRGQSAALSLSVALNTYVTLVTSNVYDNASLTRAGVALQVFDINYQAGAILGAGSQTSDLNPIIYKYATAHGA